MELGRSLPISGGTWLGCSKCLSYVVLVCLCMCQHVCRFVFLPCWVAIHWAVAFHSDCTL